MKRTIVLFVSTFGLFHAPLVEAALIELNDIPDHVVYDTNTKQYWYWNLTDFSSATFDEQTGLIGGLNTGDGYYGINTWHMAQLGEIEALFSYSPEEVGRNFFPSEAYTTGAIPPYGDWQSDLDQGWRGIWSGRIDYWLADTDSHAVASTGVGHASGTAVPINWRPFVIGQGGYGPSISELSDNDRDMWTGAWVTSVAVPEPSVLFLLGAGLVGLFGVRQTNRHP